MESTSQNFSFLAEHDPLLARLAAQAEQYFFTDPNICLIRLRQFGEVLAQRVAAHVGVFTTEQDDQLPARDRRCADNFPSASCTNVTRDMPA